jgi:hypothetical protein
MIGPIFRGRQIETRLATLFEVVIGHRSFFFSFCGPVRLEDGQWMVMFLSAGPAVDLALRIQGMAPSLFFCLVE